MPFTLKDDTTPASEPKDSTTRGDLFISRRQRRDATDAAEAEVAKNKAVADDAADAADFAAYEAKNPDRSDAEKRFNAEKSQIQATADARKKAGLKD